MDHEIFKILNYILLIISNILIICGITAYSKTDNLYKKFNYEMNIVISENILKEIICFNIAGKFLE